jgi:AcrR family transcriptional regulator
MTGPPRARRLPPDERRHQLLQAAVGLFAERGYGEVSLEDVAHAADVAPSLLYHYFPGRARELHLEAVRLACREGVELLNTDTHTPHAARQTINFAAYLDQVLARSPAYLLLSRARSSAEPDIQTELAAARDEFVRRLALNNIGTRNLTPAVALALGSYLEFVEAACQQWQITQQISRDELLSLLTRTLTAVIKAATTGEEPSNKPHQS